MRRRMARILCAVSLLLLVCSFVLPLLWMGGVPDTPTVGIIGGAGAPTYLALYRVAYGESGMGWITLVGVLCLLSALGYLLVSARRK